MNGVFGLLGQSLPLPEEVLRAMSGGAIRANRPQACVGPTFAVGAVGMPGTATTMTRNGLTVALQGHPFWSGDGARVCGIDEVAASLLDAFANERAAALDALHGDYALALLEPGRRYVLLAVDRMSVRNLTYAAAGQGIAFGPTTDALLNVPGLAAELDPQQLFNYLYFHVVPGPATVYRGWRRVPPAHYVEHDDGKLAVRPHWQPTFHEAGKGRLASLKNDFRTALDDGVRTATTGARCGAFLSGGTDSSTIAGLLGAATGAPANTFSIGFQAEGYDEMGFARIAARHFGTTQHEYYVTPDDVVDAIPRIAQAYDQPFGNASAVPTYHCARLAQQHGIERMLGGDGGDELFGGNARYARQAQFARYDAIPAQLRSVLATLLDRLPQTDRVALVRKARSYIAQASQPMPDRYDSYNLLERLGVSSVCTPDFLASVDRLAPLAHLRETWSASEGTSMVNRMLALDFKLTLADNDLPKVTRMCDLAGVDVAFPMLHDPVIDVSLALPSNYKLRGTTLRWFFKRALADFLPAAILDKQKHGFGLPVGVWLKSHRPLREMAGDCLASLRGRQIVRADFCDRLLTRHLDEHAAYYGTMVWVLMMLELWLGRAAVASRASHRAG